MSSTTLPSIGMLSRVGLYGSVVLYTGQGSGEDMWGALVVVMCGKCDRATTAAELRFAELVEATEDEGLKGNTPGQLYVGSCSDAVQWAGHLHELSMDTQ